MKEESSLTDSGPPPTRRSDRLPPATFGLPVAEIRSGLYSDKYFTRAREVLLAEGSRPNVTMQVFQKKQALLCGIDEAMAVLKLCLTEGFDWGDITVHALREGDRIAPWEPVMHIDGPYPAFAHLETLCLGVLARGTKVATNTRRVVEAAWPKPVLFFPARHDHWRLQQVDGYAAHVAGAAGISTEAQGAWWGGTGMGTVPHALIAACGGDTVLAARTFARHMPEDVQVIVLVDFDNDSVATSLAVARALGHRLHGVRLDTAETLVDRSVVPRMGRFDPRGVNPTLVHRVREALDGEGFSHVRIVVSGGFDAERIRRFEEYGVPVDSYGVGSTLLREPYDFTADVVRHEGRHCAKVGREYQPTDRLELVD